MKIATWNIGEDLRNKGRVLTDESYNDIVKEIKSSNIDVICLQEAVTSSANLPNIGKYISENTDLKYVTEYELSPSHINIGSNMGAVICSKYEINNISKFPLDNPNLVFTNNNVTFKSHNKGFIICEINGIRIITGHSLPYHFFKEDALNYKYIFEKLENRILKEYESNNKLILLGDLNCEETNILLPEVVKIANDYINEPTKGSRQYDHIYVSRSIKVVDLKTDELFSDHKLCIVEVEV